MLTSFFLFYKKNKSKKNPILFICTSDACVYLHIEGESEIQL